MDIVQLKRRFADPPSEFTLSPFWFLNHELTDEELKWQINEMHANGVRGFIMHPRHGLITEYLSEEFFSRIETCIKEADRLGMKAYLYDENNFPSGPVDGRLIEEHPEYRMSSCVLTQRLRVGAGRTVKEKLDTRDGLIAVVAVPTEKNILVGLPQSAVLLDSFVRDGILQWRAPDDDGGRWTVFVFAKVIMRSGTFFGGYLDMLNRDAVAKFIDMTHERYTERFGKYFGGTVDGMFTDEPMMQALGSDGVPFTDTLPAEFFHRHQYDFYSVLPAVFGDAGHATAQLRCDYYDTATHMYQQAFFRQVHDYCESRRLNLIGHVVYEGELYENVRYQGDFFRGAEYMSFGGCDQLCEVTWPSDDAPHGLNNLIAPKLASSAAHLFLKPRVMCECFGIASNWRIDLRTLKWLADWLVAMGVNMLQPHAFYYSIQGHRKWECPPGEFYQSAFWPYYKYFADYAARLCGVFAGADHVADAAVLFPVRSMWSAIEPGKTEESEKIVKGFQQVTTALAKAGYDFDIISEEELVGNTSPLDLEHIASGERYKVLVIPYVTTLLAETAAFVAECEENGVEIVLAGEPPRNLVVESNRLWAEHDWSGELFIDRFGIEYDPTTGTLSSRESTQMGETAVVIPHVLEISPDELAAVFSDVFSSRFEADVIVREEGTDQSFVADIVHCHYRHGENDFYLFVNTSRERSYVTQVSLDTMGVPSAWNAETGEVTALAPYDFDGERTSFALRFEPCESHVICVSAAPVEKMIVEVESEPVFGKIVPLADEWEFRTLKPNTLPLAEWRFAMESPTGEWGYAAHIYTAEFNCDAEPAAARLLIDGLLTEKIWRRSTPIHVEITLNGERVEDFRDGEYLDHLIMEAEVGSLVKRGKNVLQIRCNTQLAPAGNLSDPAYLVGDFEVRTSGNKLKIVPPAATISTGDWSEQGYPYYSGIGIYRQVVKLPRAMKNVFLRMDAPGDLAEVIVNGEFAAVLAWEPWAANITDLVKPGENEIVIKVANSMANVFLMDPKPSGILGKVEIAIAK